MGGRASDSALQSQREAERELVAGLRDDMAAKVADREAALKTLQDGLDVSQTWDNLTVAERKLVAGQALTKADLGL